MTISSAGFKSPTARRVYLILGIIAIVLLCLYILLRVFVAHAQSVANKNMNYPCPRYLFNQHPTLQAVTSDASRPDKCVHYFQTLYNIQALSVAQKSGSKVAVLLTIDGVYSRANANAVKVYQAANKLKVTGKIDSKTWYQLETTARSAK